MGAIKGTQAHTEIFINTNTWQNYNLNGLHTRYYRYQNLSAVYVAVNPCNFVKPGKVGCVKAKSS